MKNILSKILHIFLLAALVLGNMFVAPRKTLAASDDGNQGLNIDVSKDCSDVAEDQEAPDPGDVFPPQFVMLAPPLLLAGLPFGYIDWKTDSFAEALNVLGFINTGGNQKPTLKIDTGLYGVTEGDSVQLEGTAMNFKTAPEKMDFAWWQVQKVGGEERLLSLNGIAAGGEPFTANDVPINNGTRCGLMTRNPKVDADHDGMDDQWERRYSNVAGGLKPGDDPDADGYVANSFQQNETGTPYRIVSNSRASTGQSFETGDGVFTNLEEYIWGTNPLDPDSDDDGYPDEADVAGIAQSDLKYFPTDVAGLNQTIELDAMGESFLSGKDENLVTQILGYRLNLPVMLLQNFGILLSSNNASPQLNQAFRVTAESTGTNAKEGDIDYEWTITSNNVGIPVNTQGSPCHLVSFGDIVECTFTSENATPGGKLSFKVNAFDKNLGSRAQDTLLLNAGGSVVLTSNPTIVPQYPIDKTGEHLAAPAGAADVGERWIEVTASFATGSPSDYNFDWYVDEEKITDTCATQPLSFTGKAEPQGVRLCGTGTNILYYHATSGNTHSYSVNVKIYQKKTGALFADEYLPVYTDPIAAPYPGQSSGASSGLIQTQASTVSPHSVVVARASNLETSSTNTYEYIWKVDGEVVASGSQRQIQFTAQPEKKAYNIQLQVVEKNNNHVIAQRNSQTSIDVAPTSKFQEWQDSRLASVRTAFYPLYHSIAGNISLFFVVLGTMFVVGAYVFQRKELKTT